MEQPIQAATDYGLRLHTAANALADGTGGCQLLIIALADDAPKNSRGNWTRAR